MTFPTYDSASDSIQLNGGAAVMLGLLMKAKFGERFDPETLFHTSLSTLIAKLCGATDLPTPVPGECFDRNEVLQIADRVVQQSVSIRWWSMTVVEREAFLQSAVAPWILSADQVETIILEADTKLWRLRELVNAADKAKGQL